MYNRKVILAFAVVLTIAMVILMSRDSGTDLNRAPQDNTVSMSSKVPVKELAFEPPVKESTDVPLSVKQDDSLVTYTTDLGGLDNEAVDYFSEKANRMLVFPIHPGRAKLQKKIHHETFEDTFRNLTDNDNFATLIPSMGGYPFAPGTYESDMMMVSKMTRIRKLLAVARDNPQTVETLLRQELETLTDEFPQQYRQFIEEHNAESPEGRNFSELPDYMKTSIHASAAIYLLSQIGDAETLPFLAHLYVKTEGKKGSLPVDSKFLFYAMHRLAKKSQGQALDNDMKQMLKRYLRKAKRVEIENAKELEVSTWDTYYHEDDFRRKLPGNKVDLRESEKIKLERFPRLENINSRQVASLMKELSKFAVAL